MSSSKTQHARFTLIDHRIFFICNGNLGWDAWLYSEINT